MIQSVAGFFHRLSKEQLLVYTVMAIGAVHVLGLLIVVIFY